MEESNVKVSMRDDNELGCSYAIVTKKKENIRKNILIILHNLECAVFDYDKFLQNDDLKFLLLKQYENDRHALIDFYKIIGKMCHKNINSKYFLNPKDEYNRIKFNDFDNETMNFKNKKLDMRLFLFKDYINSIKNKF